MADDAAEIPIEPTVSKTVLDQFKKTFVTTLDDALEDVFKNLPALMASSEFAESKGAGAKAPARGGDLAGRIQSGARVAGMAAGMDVQGVLGAGGPWGQAAGAAIGAISQLTDTIKSFVAVANPAVVEQLNHAMADISGVIGHFLTPAVEALTPWMEMFGDFLASILPDSEQLREALAPMSEALAEFKIAIDPLLPLIRDELVRELKLLADVVKIVAEAFKHMPGMGLLRAAGSGGTDNWKSGRGMAYRGPASYQGIEQAGRGLHLAGFGQAGANRTTMAQDAQIESARTLQQINAKLDRQPPAARAAGNN